ncbi:MAG: Mor transcription activator family protein [Pseudomonadota bacterium]
MSCDFLRDILQRLLEAAQRDGAFTDALARDVEAQIRQEWGGERVYIGKTADDARIEIGRRNAAIIRDLNNGERVALISRRYRISRMMVYKIWDAYVSQRRKRKV